MFWVTSPRLEVRLRKRAEDSSGSFPARSLARTDTKNAASTKAPATIEADHQPAVVVRGEDAEHDQDQAGGREDRAAGVEVPGRVGRQRILDPSGQPDDDGDDQGLEDEGGPPADRRGDQTADQRPGRRTDAAQRADHPERAGS